MRHLIPGRAGDPGRTAKTIGDNDFKDELLIVEDGQWTTHELLQTNFNDSSYTHTMSLSSPGYSHTSTDSGRDTAANTITRNLLVETLEGSTSDSSAYSSTTVTPQGTTTTSGSSSFQTTYEFARGLTYPAAQYGWQELHYEYHRVESQHTDYPDGTDFDYTGEETITNATGIDPASLMHPSVGFGGPVMFPITGTFAPAWAADQPAATGDVYQDSGPMPDGGHWEHYDDGYQWWYTEFDAAGNVTFQESGVHEKSGGQGFQDARDTVQDGKDELAPLLDLFGARADTVEDADKEQFRKELLERSGYYEKAFIDNSARTLPHIPSSEPAVTALAAQAGDARGSVRAAHGGGPIAIADTDGNVVYVDEGAERGFFAAIGDIINDSQASEAEAYERRGYKVIRIPGASQMSQEELKAAADAARGGNPVPTPPPPPRKPHAAPPPAPEEPPPPPPQQNAGIDPAKDPRSENFWDGKPDWMIDLFGGTSGDLLDRLMTEDTSFAEGMIPIWGPMRQAMADFSHGRYIWGTVNVGFAVLDATGIGWLARGATRFFSLGRFAFSSGERIAGELFKPHLLQRLGRYLEGHGVDLVRNADAFLDDLGEKLGKQINAAFSAEAGKFYLRSQPTRREVLHELGHFLHWRTVGPTLYRLTPRDWKEQWVFAYLRANPNWSRFTLLEQLDEIANMLGHNGVPW